jgi:hypothetical protein
VELPRAKARCPLNGQKGQRVDRQTLQSLLIVDLRLVSEASYWFCPAPACPVAYFNDSGEVTFTVGQVRVPIWQKQPTEPRTPICYCFKITNQMLTEDTPAEITAGVQQELCACRITRIHRAAAVWATCGEPLRGAIKPVALPITRRTASKPAAHLSVTCRKSSLEIISSVCPHNRSLPNGRHRRSGVVQVRLRCRSAVV